ncbi:hypothetical protein [Rhizobium sp. ZPR3]|uniref:Helix-turn-helix domain-containing protein n=2 Tax=unclassified Rhizobium TaxID=2613769 RepID=A0AAU7SRS9_9HYPH
MASEVFSNGRRTAPMVDLCASGKVPSPVQRQNIFADLANSIVELWRANLAGFTSHSQIEEFKSKTLYARLWRESGGPLDTEQIEELRAAAEQRSAHLTGERYKHFPSQQFGERLLPDFLAPQKRPARVPVHRGSWRKGRCELWFWRSISKDDGRLIIRAAQRYEEHARNTGERIGPLGPIGLEILKLFVNLAIAGGGRVEPQLTWIMSKIRRSKCAVVAALARLRDHGFIDWRRRYKLTGSEGPGPQVKQTSNAYRIILETAKRVVSGIEQSPPLPDDFAQERDGRKAQVSALSGTVYQSDQRESVEQAETSPILPSRGKNQNGRPDKQPDAGPRGGLRRSAGCKPPSG